jgi:hypothetical protein
MEIECKDGNSLQSEFKRFAAGISGINVEMV